MINAIRDGIDVWATAWQRAVDAGCSTFSDDCKRMVDAVIREINSYRPADVTVETIRAVVDRLVSEYEASVIADMLQGETYPELAGFMQELSSV